MRNTFAVADARDVDYLTRREMPDAYHEPNRQLVFRGDWKLTQPLLRRYVVL